MSLLIVKTATGNSAKMRSAIERLASGVSRCKVVDTSQIQICACKGCYVCMLNTPGKCCIQDEYEQIFKLYLEYDNIVFISDTALDFINYKAKNVVDRMFPLVSVLTQYKDGEIRHIPRYNKTFCLGLLYIGNADRTLLNVWMERFAKNMIGKSLGAFPVEEVEAFCSCIS